MRLLSLHYVHFIFILNLNLRSFFKTSFQIHFPFKYYSTVIESVITVRTCLIQTIRKALVPPTRSSRTGVSFQLMLFSATDRDQTVSRRSKPSSRTALMVEQTNPWQLMFNQDAMSRHRGANRSPQWRLSEIISLLSLAYLLSVNR